MAETTKLSQDAHDRLAWELEDLKTRGRVEIAKKIEAARELGDLSENGDYHAAKEEQGKMEGRIMHLAGTLLDAEIVDSTPDTTDVVSMGCVVEVRYEGDDATEKYLVGSIEERRDGLDVISPTSPLGSQLLGVKPGKTIEFEAPTGARLKVEVVSIGA